MILAIDPATRRTGLAIIGGGGEYIDSMVHKGPVITDETNEWLFNHVADGNVSKAIIESQYIGMNKKSALMVAKANGYWTAICHSMAIPTSEVLAAVWQSKILLLDTKVKRAERKQAAKDLVEYRYALTLSEDENDAICMALYLLEVDG